jgi:hypothetical protein
MQKYRNVFKSRIWIQHISQNYNIEDRQLIALRLLPHNIKIFLSTMVEWKYKYFQSVKVFISLL